MALGLLIFVVAFAALCVWLGVRIINRRKDSDTELLVNVCGAVLLLLVVFVPSIGLYLLLEWVVRPKSVSGRLQETSERRLKGGAAKAAPLPAPAKPSGR